MTIASLIYPCLTVFAMAAPAPLAAQTSSAGSAVAAAPVEAAPATADRPVLLAQADEADTADERPELADQTTGPVRVEKADLQEAIDAIAGDEPTELDVTSERPAPEGPPVFADLTDQQVFERAVAWLESVDTMKADFIQTSPTGNVSAGTMQLSRPGRLRFDYEAPNPLLIVATQGLVYVHDSELEDTDSYPVSRTPLKFLLADEIGSDEAKLLGVERYRDTVAMVLEPTDPETEGRLVMEFAAPDLSLLRIAVYDARGGVTVTDFSNLQTGIRIANNAFRVPEAGGSFLRDR